MINVNMVMYKVDVGEGERSLEAFLRSKQISAKALRSLKRRGEVLRNGLPCLHKDMVKEGDQIQLFYPPEKNSPYLVPEKLALDIIYEDKEILVLNKQAGVCVHPTKGHPTGSLAGGVLFYWAAHGEKAVVHLVNRLDKDTSGLVLVAKNTFCAQQLFCQQSEQGISRRYLALVSGTIPTDDGCVDLPIAREEGITIRRIVSPQGQRAVTHYRAVKRFDKYTLLEISLETGRTHQIRVHLSHMGYPLVGDRLYGGDTKLLERQFLHAHSLTFYHPVRGEKLEFSCPLPSSLDKVLQELGNLS